MRRFLRDNGLSLVLFNLFFLAFIVGQSIAGFLENNEELLEHQQPLLTFGEYLAGFRRPRGTAGPGCPGRA
ncbi:MAG TPA: DUF6766 family protein [Thermoanaerobaculia bacterium]